MTSLLNSDQKRLFKENNPSWTICNNSIQKEYTFSNFIEAFSFICRIALLSEKMDHHPDLQNSYNKVIIKLTTHDMGGITTKDTKLAEDIDKLIKS